MAAEAAFRAMGTDAHVIVVGAPTLLERAMRRIAELEARWSRFLPTSEVSALNGAGGEPVAVSDDTVLLVRRAVDAWTLSAGFVDCTELHALIAAGYDRSFELLSPDRRSTGAARPLQLAGPADIVVGGGVVRLPESVGFDPGGIGKGLAADLVSAELIEAGARGVCVNVGGDLRVRGSAPSGEAWTISVDHPHRREPIALVGLADGAVATSTTLRRTWLVDGQRRHHLIDPRTCAPSTSDLALVSAVAGDAWIAEAMTKAVLLRGGPHPFDIIEGTGVEAIAVGNDGTITASPGAGRFLGGTPLPSTIHDAVPA